MNHNDSILVAIVMGVNQTLLTVLGVDYYAIIWSFLGSLVALTQTERMGRSRALLFVCLSTLVGAALGSAAFAYLGSSQPKPILLLCSVVGGFGWQLIMAALVQAVVARIKTIGGVPNEQPSESPH